MSGGLNFIRTAHLARVENLTALDRWVKTVGDRPLGAAPKEHRPAVKRGLEVIKSL